MLRPLERVCIVRATISPSLEYALLPFSTTIYQKHVLVNVQNRHSEFHHAGVIHFESDRAVALLTSILNPPGVSSREMGHSKFGFFDGETVQKHDTGEHITSNSLHTRSAEAVQAY